MLWYRAEIGVARNRKVLRLGKVLTLSLRDTVGFLHLLWSSVAEQAETGDISDWTENDIREVCQYRKKINPLNALISLGFIERSKNKLHVHGWLERNSYTLKERERAAKGMRKLRETDAKVTRDLPTDRPTNTQTREQRADRCVCPSEIKDEEWRTIVAPALQELVPPTRKSPQLLISWYKATGAMRNAKGIVEVIRSYVDNRRGDKGPPKVSEFKQFMEGGRWQEWQKRYPPKGETK